MIVMAVTSVLPYLPGQEAPGVPSTERPQEEATDAGMSSLTIAQFLAEPERYDASLKGASRDKVIEALKADGITDAMIGMAVVSVLPYLPGQEAPGVPSTERPEALVVDGDTSPLIIAQILAEPERYDASLKDASRDEVVEALKANGVSDAMISMAAIAVLPYLP